MPVIEHRAEDVAARRRDLGLSQTALAKVAGVSRTSVALIEGGYSPKRSVVLGRVFAALNDPHNNLDPAGSRAEGKASDAGAHGAG